MVAQIIARQPEQLPGVPFGDLYEPEPGQLRRRGRPAKVTRTMNELTGKPAWSAPQ